MTEQQIKAEHDRLRSILFYGAPAWVRWIAQNETKNWCWWEFKPRRNVLVTMWDSDNGRCKYAKVQPKTILHWTETLIERGGA